MGTSSNSQHNPSPRQHSLSNTKKHKCPAREGNTVFARQGPALECEVNMVSVAGAGPWGGGGVMRGAWRGREALGITGVKADREGKRLS